MIGNLEMTSGRHYWEIKIIKCIEEEGLFIGIARKDLKVEENPIDSPNFIGYMS